MAQLRNLAQSQIPVGFVSSMPDVHLGMGVTIGCVFASDKLVCPNAVGVDIGCGMTAIPFNFHKEQLTLEMKKKIQSMIKTDVPTGFNQYKFVESGIFEVIDDISTSVPPTNWITDKLLTQDKIPLQLGTLGGGNHFIEVLYDESGMIWCMLHSGSRSAGKQTAGYYDKLAQENMKSMGISKYPAGLAYLNIESNDGQNYLNDMLWCQKYAFQNREIMLNKVIQIICDVTGSTPNYEKRINAHHNFCECTPCSYKDPKSGIAIEKDLWITRKGATSAKAGQYGIIPGSMGVGSYIVKGKGNTDSWSSCSHGAGRLMSRTMARKVIKQDQFELAMTGIVCDTDNSVIDEAPMAYKDLETVMRDQEDLVEIVHRLLPLINVKGFEKK